MRAIFAAMGLVGITFATGPAVANDENVCVFGNDNSQRVAACTRVIGDRRIAARLRWVGYLARGEAYEKLGDDAQAIADYSEAIRLHPNAVLASIKLAQIYQRQREFDRAIVTLSATIKVAPKFSTAYLVRGAIFYVKNDHARALADFDKVIQMLPADTREQEFADTLSGAHLGRAFILSDRGEYDRAIKEVTAAIRLSPDHEANYRARCDVHLMMNNAQQAIADCDEAIRLKPTSDAAFAIRGLVKLKVGQLESAATDYETAIKLNPDSANALYGRAIIRYRKKEYNGAAADVAAAISIDQDIVSRYLKHELSPEK